jgi:hypothetical protein
MSNRVLRVLVALAAASLLAACSVEPWVKPYERANLADPIMSFSPNPVEKRYMDHIYEVRESARGATGAGGGGCGCN